MKPVEKTDEDVSGALVNTRNKNGSVALAVNQINSFEQAEALADWIAQSPVFNKGFKEQVQKEDGSFEVMLVMDDALIKKLDSMDIGSKIKITYKAKAGQANKQIIKVN